MITGDLPEVDMEIMAHITRFVVHIIVAVGVDVGTIEVDVAATNKKTAITEMKIATAMETT